MDLIYLAVIVMVFTLSVYVFLYAASYVCTVFSSSKARKLYIRNKYLSKNYTNNLIVVVYTHNQEKAASYLLEALNKQNYPKVNCQLHFILDNCTDNTANMLEFIGGAKLWKVGDGVTLGKDEAISWLLERLIHIKNSDAFVFLDINRKIDEDFLHTINRSLITNDIVSGTTEIETEDASLISTVSKLLNKYKHRIVNTGRAVCGLVTFVDVNCFAIKHSVLEQIKYLDFKDNMSSFKYTLLLARKNYLCTFDPNIKTKMTLQEYFDTQESFKNKFVLFLKCVPMFFRFNFKFNEAVMNMITPNALSVVAILLLLIAYTSYFYFLFDLPIFLAVSGILLLFYASSLFIGKFSFKEASMISTSIVSRYILRFLNFDFFTNIKKTLKGEKVVPVIKTATRRVIITDGRNNLECNLELVSEDGMARAVLKFKKKKYTSEYYLRMYDAINDIVSTLNEHGFRVKICASCGYFTSLIDGTTNMIKGTCNKCVIDKTSDTPEEVLLWNGCENYIPQEVNKVVDISTYRAN